MKSKFECEVCLSTHKDETSAVKCENGHYIVMPNKYWLIPFVGWILTPYYLFTKKNAIVIFENHLLQSWVGMGPILLICVLSIFYICNWDISIVIDSFKNI